MIAILYSAIAFCKKQENNKSTLMPLPVSISYEEGYFVITKNFSIKFEGYKSERTIEYANRILRRIDNKTGIFFNQGYLSLSTNPENANLKIKIDRKGKLKLGENESYSLQITDKEIKIEAETEFGAQHALETLYQLISVEDGNYVFPKVKINDSPRFTWRGMMYDVSRHFMEVGDIKRNLDLMSAVKMNVFHWHLSDDQGFRVEVTSHPELYKKGSDGKYYTKSQIKDVVKYAGDRGIRVIPEFDVPGHATAILVAMPELSSKDTTYTIERNAGIFLPVLDPTNPKVYKVLDDVFGEMAELFPDEYFHIGGDENAGKNWMANKDIVSFMKKNNLNNPHELQAYFNTKIYDILKKHGKEMMGWEEIQADKIPKSAVIQSWRGVNEGMQVGMSLAKAVKKGYKTVLSNGFYIDLLLPAKSHYSTKFVPENISLTEEQEKLILGGEATMWSELVTPLTLDSRVWPRGAAIAEKFWSPKKKTNDIDDMYRRLDIVSNTLEEIGSQHKRNQLVIIRNISNNKNTDAIKLLVDVCEPMKVYSRNPGGTMYKSYSPFTKFADACVVDAKGAREFDKLVSDFEKEKQQKTIFRLKEIFTKWKNNNAKFEETLLMSPMLSEVEKKSKNLMKLGEMGLSLLENGSSKESINEYLLVIDNMAKDEGGRTHLVITDSMKSFVENFKP